MKCQILFFGENVKIYFKMPYAEFAHSVLSVNHKMHSFCQVFQTIKICFGIEPPGSKDHGFRHLFRLIKVNK